MSLPQLYMRKSDLTDLPELAAKIGGLPEGITLRTHREGDDELWENLIEKSFGNRYGFEGCMRKFPGYRPEHCFYLTRDGKDIAVAAAVENRDFPGEGWLHFVGVDPEARGLGLAKKVVLAVLVSFYLRGFKTVILSTDDFRLSAIKTYLDLGFTPVMSHESHPARWDEVLKKLG